VLDDGSEIVLPQGFDPELYYEICMDENNHIACNKVIIFWGRFLIQNPLTAERRLDSEEIEIARGWDFIGYAYNSLLNDLIKVSDDPEQFRKQLDFHIQAAISPPKIISQWPHDVLVAATEYYLLIWENLPKEPISYHDFRYKFDVGEYLKSLISDLNSNCDYDLYSSALKFYDEANAFHRLTFPDDCSVDCPEEIHGEISYEGLKHIGVVYANMHGGIALEPQPVLSNTDLQFALELINSMYRRGLIEQEEFELKKKYFDSCMNATNIANHRYWIDHFRAVGDKENMIESMIDLAAIYKDLEEYDSVEVILESAYSTQKELGNIEQWIPTLCSLISYKINGEKWNEAISLFDQFDGQQYDYLIISDLEKFREIVANERYVATKIGLTDRVERVMSDFDAAIAAYESFAYGPAYDAMSKFWETHDLQERRQLLSPLLKDDLIPPYLRFKVKLVFLNTLQEHNQFDEAVKWAQGLLPETIRWQGIIGQSDLNQIILENQLSSGDYGGFLRTLSEWEKVKRKFKGDNWVNFDITKPVTALIQLQNYHRAEEILSSYLQTIQGLRLHYPLNADNLQVDADQAMLLLAKVNLRLGHEDVALKVIDEFEQKTATLRTNTGVTMQNLLDSKVNSLIQLAQLAEETGNERSALEKLEKVMPEINPYSNFSMWMEVMIQLSRLRIALNESPDSTANIFENIVPRRYSLQDMDVRNAVLMDIFLSDYYVFKGDTALAKARLTRALPVAENLGLSDELLAIYNKLGELAYNIEDYEEAEKQLGKALDKLNTISSNIDTDVSKVGYRHERNRVIPLYVKTLHKRYLLTNDSLYLEDMFKKADMGKSRALAELILVEENEFLMQGLNLESLRGILGDHSAIMEYYIPEGVDDIVYRFFIDRATLMVDILDIRAEELNRGISSLLNDVVSTDFDETDFKEMAGNLASLILPEELYLGKDMTFRQLYIVPTGNLHLFPFHLLVDAQGKYLDENTDIDIAYLPNATILLRQQKESPEHYGSGAFVNPSLAPDLHDVLSDNIELRDTLTQTFYEWAECRLDWEQLLTKNDFLERMTSLENVFIYSHAKFLLNDPMSSYISLAGKITSSGELSAMDLLTAETGNGLWTLAGCSSGEGKVQSGDEVLGLPRAILQAGASVVVVSLWDIGASSSLKLMNDFYKNLSRDMPVAEALRDARMKCRSSGNDNDPFDWAPFIMIGYHGKK
jgi:CHAT domain-containing protein